MISIHIIRYNNILKLLSIIIFLILIIVLNNNIYDELKEKSNQYDLITLSCNNNAQHKLTSCQNIFEEIFQIFYNININKQKLVEYSERKITTYEEFENGFIKSGKGYFNFYIYKSEKNIVKFEKLLKLIDNNKKKTSIKLFSQSEEVNSINEGLKMIFEDDIYIKINFE